MGIQDHEEETRLRSVALRNATSILRARLRAEADLLRTQEALRESQERLHAALRAAGTGTFRWDMQTNAVDWDGNLDRLFGLDPASGPQSLDGFVAAVHSVDRPGVTDQFERCARTGSDFEMEFRVVRMDGSVRWISVNAKTFFDRDARPLYMTGACADVTARKQAGDALRESEARLRAIFNQAAVGIAVAGMDGRFVDMNGKFAEVLGRSDAELLTLTFLDVTFPEDVDATRVEVGRLLAGSIPDYTLEKRYVRGDGRIVWSLTTVTLLKDAAGRPLQFIGVVEDITARKSAEEAVRQSEARFRQLAEALRDETRILELLNRTGTTLASTLDLEALVQLVTDAATELSGAHVGAFFYNAADLEADTVLLSSLPDADRDRFEQFARPCATTLLGSAFQGEAAIRCDDVLEDARCRTALLQCAPGADPPVRSCLAVPVRSPSGEAIGGLFFGHAAPHAFTERAERLVVGVAAQAGIAIDNARLYEAAQRSADERMALLESEQAARAVAERMGEMKDQFLATLSHELRTPLNAILGWSQVLRNGPKDDADLKRGLDTIERNARVQTQLIEDLLDMSRITSGKLRLDVQRIHPVTVIEAAVETLQPAADAKGIRLEKFLDPSAGPISGDPGRLQQVIWNLLSNAIKFTSKHGKVQIVLERVDSHIEISVADTGVGIKPEFIAHLFERFRQGDASTTRRFGGLGLGLSIVKSLVELHGGHVVVRSPGDGEGTTVTVHLPQIVVHRSADAPERLHPKTPRAPASGLIAAELAGIKVLVVDDQPDARELIKRVLEECAAEVITAGSAHEAVHLVQEQQPDVLVSDIGMPEADGFELLRRVRALGPARGGRVPAIALTAFARSEDRTRALRAGFVVHVSKPVDPSELIATVASVVRRVDEQS